MVASGLKSMSLWIMVMILPPSQLAAYIPAERIHYHTFTFCLDTCGTFCWVIYLCWILWVVHPNHFSSGLWIQKPIETKPLALLNFLAWLILLTIDTGYLRIWYRLFPPIAMDMWVRRLLGSIQIITIFHEITKKTENLIWQNTYVYVCVCIYQCLWYMWVWEDKRLHTKMKMFVFAYK